MKQTIITSSCFWWYCFWILSCEGLDRGWSCCFEIDSGWEVALGGEIVDSPRIGFDYSSKESSLVIDCLRGLICSSRWACMPIMNSSSSFFSSKV